MEIFDEIEFDRERDDDDADCSAAVFNWDDSFLSFLNAFDFIDFS